MKRTAILLLLAIALACGTYAADTQTEQEPGHTHLEKFAATKGAVIVTGMSDLGWVTSQSGMGRIALELREYINAKTNEREKGIRIEIKSAGEYPREASAFLDYSEIEPLLAGLDYIAKVDRKVTKLDGFEAAYVTTAGLKVTVFTQGNGTGLAVSLDGNSVTAFLEMAQVADLKAKLTEAKQVLDKL